jgi:phosphoribosyl 1,2-cyclic phosphate phosphodiesterase
MEKNEKVKLLFLGTGTSQGVPLIACPCEVCQSEDSHDKRLRSSVVFQAGGKNIVIDTGPDFRQQMLRSGIKSISAVLFTHEHKDHVAGLDDVRAYNYILKKPIDVYLRPLNGNSVIYSTEVIIRAFQR